MATSGRFAKTVDGCDFVYDYICTKCTNDNEAFLYCPKCDIYYCKACLQSLCKHFLLGQDDKDRWGKKNAPVQINSDVECSSHKGYRLDLFCRRHDVVCCSLCSQLDHKECHMEFTPDVAGEVKLAVNEKELHSYAQQLRKQADDIKKNRTGRQTDAKAHKAATVKSIQDFTGGMVAKLKALETDGIRDVETNAATCDGALQADIDVCSVAVTELTQVQTTLAKKETDSVTKFIKNRKLKQSLKNTDKTLTDLNQNHKLENEDVSFHLNLDIETVLSKFDKLGSFKTTHAQQSKRLIRPSKSPRPYKAVNKASVSVRVMEDEETCAIEALCQIPDGSIVASDWANKKLKKLDRSYKVTCHCSLPAKPYGVCFIDGDEVAVALDNKTIHFVSVGDSMALLRSLSPGHGCRGVAHHKGRLYVTGGSALYVYSLSGAKLHVFNKDQNGQNIFSIPWHIALGPSGNTVYVADQNKCLITIDAHGHVLATCSPPDLKFTKSVTVADDGSVFVGGQWSHNIIQVGEEGNKKLADVVTSSDGINCPWGICYDKRVSKLIVGINHDNFLVMFDLTQ